MSGTIVLGTLYVLIMVILSIYLLVAPDVAPEHKWLLRVTALVPILVGTFILVDMIGMLR